MNCNLSQTESLIVCANQIEFQSISIIFIKIDNLSSKWISTHSAELNK